MWGKTRGVEHGGNREMPNYAGGSQAVCPYYLKEGPGYLCCEGFVPGMRVHCNFRGAEEKAAWITERCAVFAYAARCPIAAALEALHDEKPREA